jgi:hypothetical protein
VITLFFWQYAAATKGRIFILEDKVILIIILVFKQNSFFRFREHRKLYEILAKPTFEKVFTGAKVFISRKNVTKISFL